MRQPEDLPERPPPKPWTPEREAALIERLKDLTPDDFGEPIPNPLLGRVRGSRAKR